MKQHLTLSVTPAVRAKLQALADELGLSVSALVSLYATQHKVKRPAKNYEQFK